jgi:4-aminobutyrate aminotransferase/(S)-3-amino-2-methylpropionate transaminase
MKSIVLKTAIPGPKSVEFMERRKKVISSGVSIGKIPILASHAEGALITDVDGNRFIDFTGGIGCLNAGHCPPRVVAAVERQAKLLHHACFQVAMYEPYVALAEKLVQITPGRFAKKVALFNSGAEAVENAVKVARRFTGRQAILCFDNAFHGRTNLALSLTSKAKPYKDGFGPFAAEIYRAPLPYLYRRPAGISEDAYVDECIHQFHRFLKVNIAPERIAGVILEPVLGEGGFIIPPAKFVNDVVQTCRDNAIVFIADEVQSGFARTGKMFASEHFGLEPDLMTLAKSLSNGFPVSAVVGKADIMDAVQPGGLGSTFGGNPVACVAALAAIETIEQERLCERSVKIGNVVKERLTALTRQVKCLGEVRNLGAMVAIEIVKNGKEPDKESAEKLVTQCGQQGLLLLTAGVEGNIIRTLMPLCIGDDQLNEAMSVLCNNLQSLSL